MSKKQMIFKTKGMNKDLSVSAFSPEFSFENRNLRLSTNDGNTMLSWVTERGTRFITLKDRNNATTTMQGRPIGVAVVNHHIIIFTTTYLENVSNPRVGEYTDYIYSLKYSSKDTPSMRCYLLFSGDLNFCAESPLETLVSYESENIQKVYWVDNRNQPRFMNVTRNYLGVDPSKFDFVPKLSLQETITVSKGVGGGSFPSGVIQYAFTYYNKYGQESNIFYTSPLRYVSPLDRGAAPDEMVDNIFNIQITNVDTTFDYVRVYSIQRTSINGTPIVKRVQDISLSGLSPDNPDATPLVYTVKFTDTGVIGNTIDPTELLYKGGQNIIAETLEQKDGTLFFGNIQKKNANLINSLTSAGFYDTVNHKITGISLDEESNSFNIATEDNDNALYPYANQLNLINDSEECGCPCSGFKAGNTYRCGIQFQHESGRWSDVFYIEDYPMQDIFPRFKFETTRGNHYELKLRRIEGTIGHNLTVALQNLGYIKARPVVVYPELNDKKVILQGVANPTVFTDNHRGYESTPDSGNFTGEKDIYTQSSWFFRPMLGNSSDAIDFDTGLASPYYVGNDKYLYYMGYMGDGTNLDPYDDNPGNKWNIRQVEIQGAYNPINEFKVDWSTLTLNSPDIEFDPQAQIMSYKNMKWCDVGHVKFYHTLSAIDIQTETPNAGRSFLGFVNKSFKSNDSKGIVAGLFYEDTIIDDGDFGIGPAPGVNSPFSWFVYPWHRNGSLNNDINRPSGLGTQSALLKKKVISNLRVTNSNYEVSVNDLDMSEDPQVFNSEDFSILKFNSVDTNYSNIYRGNIDTVLKPDHTYPLFSALSGDHQRNASIYGIITPFTSNDIWATALGQNEATTGLYFYDTDHLWHLGVGYIGNSYNELVEPRDFVRMKYKSSPHLVVWTPSGWSHSSQYAGGSLPIIELRRSSLVNPFGGTSIDALKENVWVPCGKPKLLGNKVDEWGETITKVNFNYGDAYYQRYDCLKTYAFTQEDPNQIVEIGSFMLETYVNIDGRYDKNRCQMNNNNMSPRNFNLINPVYTQKDNFFTYRIADDNTLVSENYPNLITWSTKKESGADTDAWTNITLASTLEMDGNKGDITSIKRFNDQLICFQESGISQILYNERTQISTTEGVPIEIANSGKVDGKNYISNNVGCCNKWSIASSPNGIYFIDSNERSIYLFNGQLSNISIKAGFNSWCKKNILYRSNSWNPWLLNDFVAYYDKMNADVLFISDTEALAYNEKIGAFTSFYSYNAPFFCNYEDTGIWITPLTEVWQHQTGDYCSFFGGLKSYGITLIGNPEPQVDKLFTNLEFRACVDGEGIYYNATHTFVPSLPFDSLEVWNEYQHGITTLQNKNGSAAMQHPTSTDDRTSALKRRFRIWRCDIPRDNAPTTDDAALGITRYSPNPLNRIRNPWAYLKLGRKANTVTSGRYLQDPQADAWILSFGDFIKDGYLTEIGADNKYRDTSDLKVSIKLYRDLQHITETLLTVNGLPYTLSVQEIDSIIREHVITGYEFVFIEYISGTAPIDPETGYRQIFIRWKIPVNRTEIHDIALTYFD